MEIFLLVLSSVISILLLIIGVTVEKNIAGFLIGASYLVSISCVVDFADRVLNKNERKLTPIEVYRGNTTLQITYRDSVAIDSMVVWKE